MLKSLVSLLLLFVSMPVAADEGDEALKKEDIIYEQILGPSKATKELKVLIHKAGHLENRPYVIEISELCKGERIAIDTASACDVAKDSVRFDAAKSEVTILTREPSSAQRSTDKPDCRVNAKRLVFHLQTHCE